MGIDLYCGSKTFGCSYSGWNSLRCDIVIATIRYLEALLKSLEEDLITKTKNEYDIYEDDKDNMNQRYIIDLKILLENYNTVKHNTENLAVYVHEMNLATVDSLIMLGVGGLYALCNKADCEGYYSVGNSYDIVDLLKLIKPYMDYSDYSEEWINELNELFQESVDIKEKIVIA